MLYIIKLYTYMYARMGEYITNIEEVNWTPDLTDTLISKSVSMSILSLGRTFRNHRVTLSPASPFMYYTFFSFPQKKEAYQL